MTYDARQIANWFIQRAAIEGRALSIMSLLKLTYIAHGWRLEISNRPLFENRIEAWQHGPVIPDVYHAFRPQGVVPQKLDPNFPPPVDAGDEAFLEQIYGIYAQLSPFRLSELTHVPGGPWDTARKWGGQYAEIPNDLIQSHYVSKRQQANQASA
jgi:uncharacterized phage-associated protein